MVLQCQRMKHCSIHIQWLLLLLLLLVMVVVIFPHSSTKSLSGPQAMPLRTTAATCCKVYWQCSRRCVV
jgi:hypothetical protein